MIVDQFTAQNRYNICKICEKFNSITKQCFVCFCFMPAKVKFESSKCPLEKW